MQEEKTGVNHLQGATTQFRKKNKKKKTLHIQLKDKSCSNAIKQVDLPSKSFWPLNLTSRC